MVDAPSSSDETPRRERVALSEDPREPRRLEALRIRVRRRTWIAIVLAAAGVVLLASLLYLQQRAVVVESHLIRQDLVLAEIQGSLLETQERQSRLAWLMAHVVRRFPEGSVSRVQAWSLLASDSGIAHLSLVSSKGARLLWSRGESQPWLARKFYAWKRDLTVSDIEAPPPDKDTTWDAVVSVRVKGVFPNRDLELSGTGRSLRQSVEPFLLNRGVSLGIVNSKGIWFSVFERDSTMGAPARATALSKSVFADLRKQPRGILWRGPGGEGDPLPQGSLVNVRSVKVWGGLEWLLVLHLPRREVTAPLLAQFGWTAVIFLGLSCVWIVLAWALLRRDLRLSRLEADLERLQELRRKDEQLLQAEKLATVGVLVSGLAHEIGTPLGIVSMRLQLLRRKTSEGDDDRKTLDTSLEQLDRVTGLIRQLLDFARSRPGPAQKVALHDAVRAVRDLVGPLASRRRVSLVFDVPLDLPPVSGSLDGLQQIVLNLVMNALQAVPEDGRVVVGAGLEATGDVVLHVEDDGPGIPEENRAAVFDPFFTTKRQGEGSGLGLTVVLGLVRRMEGNLRVGESPLGGARFEVKFRPWQRLDRSSTPK